MLSPKACVELEGPNGERLFAQQISSFFSRLAAKACQQEVQVTEQDVLAVEEQVNFSTARDTVLSSPHITHPSYCCRSVRSVCLSLKEEIKRK